ncbi:efflux RND transporter periplasmic adaptor subunit [Chitinophagaceae bacterium LWZ2-11]
MTQTTLSKHLITLSLIISLVTLLSCNNKPKQQERQPQPYKVLTVTETSAVLNTDYPATLQGIQDIEIRLKIDGYIENVFIDEGAIVKKGQLLFKVRNPQYEADVRNYTAAISSAEADVASAQLQVKKTKPLVDKDIISSYELESNQLTLKAKEAALVQAKANLANAQTNLSYTSITSPVDGVVGTLPYKQGSYVSSSTSTALTIVSNISKVYAYFSLNEKQGPIIFAGTEKNASQQLPVTLILPDGSNYSEKGKIESISGQVNTQTGSFNVRAGFPNNAGQLRSGGSATIRIATPANNAILIPQSATYELQGKRMACIIDKNNSVTAKEIQVREVPGGKFFVADTGLTVGDKILLEGVGVLNEGTKIVPIPANTDSVLNVAGK